MLIQYRRKKICKCLSVKSANLWILHCSPKLITIVNLSKPYRSKKTATTHVLTCVSKCFQSLTFVGKIPFKIYMKNPGIWLGIDQLQVMFRQGFELLIGDWLFFTQCKCFSSSALSSLPGRNVWHPLNFHLDRCIWRPSKCYISLYALNYKILYERYSSHYYSSDRWLGRVDSKTPGFPGSVLSSSLFTPVSSHLLKKC